MSQEKTTVDTKVMEAQSRVKALSSEYRDGMGQLSELSDFQMKQIKKKLKDEITQWKSDTADLMNRLQDFNDLVEASSIDEGTDWPWEDASNVHVDIVGVYMDVYHSIERRSILGPEQYWVAEIDPEYDQLSESIQDIEACLNYKARSEWNVEEGITDALYCVNRDGIVGVKVPMVVQYEDIKDVLYIGSREEFLEDLPDPETAGMSPEDFEAALQMADQATEDDPLEIPVNINKCTYRGPKLYVIERANLVTFPANTPDLGVENCRGYGDRYTLRAGEIKKKLNEKEWDEVETRKLLNGIKKTGAKNTYNESKDRIVGISSGDNKNTGELYEIVYRWPTKNGEKKMMFIYSFDHDALPYHTDYWYRVDIMTLLRISKRPNQLDGKGIPERLAPLNAKIDRSMNQRVNSRDIANVPSFVAHPDLKKDFDTGRQENRFYPGVIFWNSYPEKFQQFKVQPVDHGDSIVEDQNDMRTASLIMGVDAFLFSGRPSPEDPGAPAKKAEILVNQGNLRMEDPLAELRFGIEQIGQICLSHLYQFGPSSIEYYIDSPGKKEKRTIYKRLLRQGVKLKMHGLTVINNPETEFRKWMAYRELAMTEPMVANVESRRVEWLRKVYKNGRVSGIDTLLPTAEEMKQIEAEKYQMAIAEKEMEGEVQQLRQAQSEVQGKIQEVQSNKKMKKAQESQNA